jgi:hypothetical protein
MNVLQYLSTWEWFRAELGRRGAAKCPPEVPGTCSGSEQERSFGALFFSTWLAPISSHLSPPSTYLLRPHALVQSRLFHLGQGAHGLSGLVKGEFWGQELSFAALRCPALLYSAGTYFFGLPTYPCVQSSDSMYLIEEGEVK